MAAPAPLPPLPDDPRLRPPRLLIIHLHLGMYAGIAALVVLAAYLTAKFPAHPALNLAAFALLGALAAGFSWLDRQKHALDGAWAEVERAKRGGNPPEVMAALMVCATHTLTPKSHAAALYDLGLLRLRLGAHDEALRLFGSLERHPGRDRAGFASASAGQLAICHALLGHAVEARAWIAQSRAPGRAVTAPAVDLAFFAEVAVLAREGDWPAAISLIDAANGHELDASWDDDTARSRYVLEAYVHTHADDEDEPRYDEYVTQCLSYAKEHLPHDYGYLGTHWPEMAFFVERMEGGAKDPKGPWMS